MEGTADDLYHPAGVIKRLLEEEWDNHNTLEEGGAAERDISTPDPIIDKERPPTGGSSRSLPKSIRAQPCMYVWISDGPSREKGDVQANTEDHDAVVRSQIVVANGKNGRDGGETLTDYIRVIEEVRKHNYAPVGGVAGSRFSNLHPGNIDTQPTEYSNQWRANIDFELKAHKVRTRS